MRRKRVGAERPGSRVRILSSFGSTARAGRLGQVLSALRPASNRQGGRTGSALPFGQGLVGFGTRFTAIPARRRVHYCTLQAVPSVSCRCPVSLCLAIASSWRHIPSLFTLYLSLPAVCARYFYKHMRARRGAAPGPARIREHQHALMQRARVRVCAQGQQLCLARLCV
eukprot:6185987-Pleurochrysis_carterae.AAC.1